MSADTVPAPITVSTFDTPPTLPRDADHSCGQILTAPCDTVPMVVPYDSGPVLVAVDSPPVPSTTVPVDRTLPDTGPNNVVLCAELSIALVLCGFGAGIVNWLGRHK